MLKPYLQAQGRDKTTAIISNPLECEIHRAQTYFRKLLSHRMKCYTKCHWQYKRITLCNDIVPVRKGPENGLWVRMRNNSEIIIIIPPRATRDSLCFAPQHCVNVALRISNTSHLLLHKSQSQINPKPVNKINYSSDNVPNNKTTRPETHIFKTNLFQIACLQAFTE